MVRAVSRVRSSEHVISHQRSADMIPKFLFPFLPYRSFAFPFLVLCAIAVPCWLVFRLFRFRTPGHRLSFIREFLFLTFVVYFFVLVMATLLPNHYSRLYP